MDTDYNMTPISSPYIRERFMWDRMCDVKWDLVRNNYDSICRVLNHPERFPNADMDAIETAQIELSSFLMLKG